MFIIHRNEKGKPTSESAIEDRNIDLFDAKMSLDEVIFGGRILNIVNDIARTCAKTHSETNCLTTGIDFVRYHSTIKRDDKLKCLASVNRVWGSIIEVGVKVVAEDFRLLEQRNILVAYFTFKSVDESANEVIAQQVIPENEKQKLRFIEADKRKKIRENRLLKA
ncbi:MAG: hypothetical protein JXA94_01145 [Parachlamydiales bacterium]|nr:hypothetical protein [Parachlamydiales bacterium]